MSRTIVVSDVFQHSGLMCEHGYDTHHSTLWEREPPLPTCYTYDQKQAPQQFRSKGQKPQGGLKDAIFRSRQLGTGTQPTEEI